MGIRFTYLLIALLSSLSLTAGDVSFIAKAQPKTVAVGERFQVSFTLNTSGSQFVAPDFGNFRILSGPNQSTSMQFINGRNSSSVTISYILQATEKGEFKIAPAKVKVGSEQIQSNTLKIKVLDESKSLNQQRRTDDGEKLDNYVFLKVTVDKTKAYVGEKITATYKLYTRVTIADLNTEDIPSLNGFWSQDIQSLTDRSEWESEYINGQRFNVAELKKTLLYPQRPGELEIDPLSLRMIIRVQTRRGRSIFDQVFGSVESREVLVASKPMKIKVKGLPQKQSADFVGAVGEFRVQMTANKSEVKANEAVDLKIKVTGKGNLQLLSAPELGLPPDFEVYDPKTEDKLSTNASGISGSRTFNYLIIPRHAGDFTIDPYHFEYFDLKSNSYRRISSDPIKLKVLPSEEENTVSYGGIQKEEVALLNEDIRFISLNTNLLAVGSTFYDSGLFYALLFLPFLLLLLLFFLRKRQKEVQGDTVKLRMSKANKLAKKRLSTAKQHLDKGEDAAFYEAIATALFGYYGDKFNLSLSELSKEKIKDLMNGKGATDALITHFDQVINAAEMARFAPSASMSASMLYEAAVELISKTEEALKA